MYFRRIFRALVPAIFAVSVVRGEEQPNARKPRPPPDYSRRVQLHELPATAAPPKPPDLKEEAPRVEAPGAPHVLSDRPLPALPPQPVPPAPDVPMSGLRDLINDMSGRPELRSSLTGWGWLAEDIATNRARRAERELRQRASETDREQEDALSAVEREDQRSLVNVVQPDRRDEQSRPEARSDAVRMLNPSLLAVDPSSAEAALDLDPNAVSLSTERAMAVDSAERMTELAPAGSLFDVRFEPNRFGPSDPVRATDRFRPTDRFSAIDRFGPADRFRPPDRDLAERALPARSLFEGARLPNIQDFRTPNRPSDADARIGLETAGDSLNLSPLWTAPAFSPMALGPAEISVSPIPSASMPAIGTIGAEPSAPAMKSIGSDLERAAPRTLPW